MQEFVSLWSKHICIETLSLFLISMQNTHACSCSERNQSWFELCLDNGYLHLPIHTIQNHCFAHIIVYKCYCITSQEKEAGELAIPTDQWLKQASSRFLDKKLQQQVFRWKLQQQVFFLPKVRDQIFPKRWNRNLQGENSWLLLCSALTDGPYSYI